MGSELRLVLLLIASLTVINLGALAQSYVAQSFISNEIVPYVIPVAPEHEVFVIYPSGVRVNLGNELTPTQVKDIPIVVYNAAPDCFYTLAFVDPDVPSRAEPVSAELKHWLVVNIPGNNVALGKTLAEFIGSAPANATGLHRYVFLVYKQPDLLTFDEPYLNNTSSYNRNKFSIALFAEKYNLDDPIAGNFYQAQYDDYTPILRAQLGIDLNPSVTVVVPDVISKSPENKVVVIYVSGVQVNLGNELTPTQVKDSPTVTWNASSDSYYTLALTEPDAPSRADPTSREFQHWLVGNILGDNILSGETLSAYVGSGPNLGTGFHRYVFLVYKQPGKLTFDERRLTNTSSENRSRFSITNFAEKYGLGDPIAGNFYQAQYDDYVPILYEQMGI